MQIYQQDQSPSKEESHQAKVLNRDKVQGAPSREDHRNRVRVLLDRGQSQDKGPLARDQGKVREHQGRLPNHPRDHQGRGQSTVRDSQARVPLVKDYLGRDPGKARVHRDRKMGPLNKDL